MSKLFTPAELRQLKAADDSRPGRPRKVTADPNEARRLAQKRNTMARLRGLPEEPVPPLIRRLKPTDDPRLALKRARNRNHYRKKRGLPLDPLPPIPPRAKSERGPRPFKYAKPGDP